jgi:polysaccharide biosynthesis transport protein
MSDNHLNNGNGLDKFEPKEPRSLRDFLLLIRANLTAFIIIAVVIFAGAIYYAISSPDIYKSTVRVQIEKQQQSVLQSSTMEGLNNFANDRYIANEIQVIKTYDTRERVAKALIDTFNNSRNKNIFSVIKAGKTGGVSGHKTVDELAGELGNVISAEQMTGLDIVEISAESPSPMEAKIIANTYANQYSILNLEQNRNQLTTVRKFLEDQSKEKLQELNNAEDSLTRFQEKGGIISLDAQSTALINQLAQLDAERDGAKIDLMSSNEVLTQYKEQLKKQDPQLADYLENQTSEAYINVLQKQIAELQISRDMALSNNRGSNIDVSGKIKDMDQRLDDLKQKLNAKINEIKASAYASSPDQVKDITQKVIEEQVQNYALASKVKEIQSIIDKYEVNFNKLPKTSIELARYERKKEGLSQLYTMLEQKYQEALINELSQPGDVDIIEKARVSFVPSEPNRKNIIIFGFLIALGAAFGFVLIKDYFDDTIKSPEDIEKKKINLIAWIPKFETAGKNGTGKEEFIMLTSPESSAGEAFKALGARVFFSKVEPDSLKTILVTSPAPAEGKSIISINLAGSFALSGKRTLIVDCDLRNPRIHSLMNSKKEPGLVDLLFNKAELNAVIRKSEMNNVSYVSSGTIPPNPLMIFQSQTLRSFFDKMKEEFDVIVIDSAPIIAVADSEILARMVDGTLLVVSANKTEVGLMESAVNLIKNDKAPFLGTILNNFERKNGYGYYYKYYYYYSHSTHQKRSKRHSQKAK